MLVSSPALSLPPGRSICPSKPCTALEEEGWAAQEKKETNGEKVIISESREIMSRRRPDNKVVEKKATVSAKIPRHYAAPGD